MNEKHLPKEESEEEFQRMADEIMKSAKVVPSSEIETEFVHNVEAEPRPELVEKYKLFKEKLNPKSDVVYYPCGAADVSPSIAFPDSKVIYVDIDKNSVDAVKGAGYDAHNVSALEFNPGDVDILIMLNPQIPNDIPSSYVLEGGYVLCNDYHGTASSLRQDKQYQLKAVIRKLKDQEPTFDTEELEDYWKESKVNDVSSVIKKVTGNKLPDFGYSLRKKGGIDDIFVFQKIAETPK